MRYPLYDRNAARLKSLKLFTWWNTCSIRFTYIIVSSRVKTVDAFCVQTGWIEWRIFQEVCHFTKKKTFAKYLQYRSMMCLAKGFQVLNPNRAPTNHLGSSVRETSFMERLVGFAASSFPTSGVEIWSFYFSNVASQPRYLSIAFGLCFSAADEVTSTKKNRSNNIAYSTCLRCRHALLEELEKKSLIIGTSLKLAVEWNIQLHGSFKCFWHGCLVVVGIPCEWQQVKISERFGNL